MNLADAYNTRQIANRALTKRELQVASHIARNFSYKQIGAALGISDKTVSKHAESMHKKLGIQTIVQVTHWAIAHGFVSPITDWTKQ
jgi:DNA-binding NarL/FixJ family response regulator